MNEDKLTPKQERFIQNIVSGMTQRQAYKEAYEATYDDNAIDIKASQLFNLDKVQIRYQELISKLDDEAIMSAKARMKWLTEVVNNIQKEEIRVKTPDNNEVVVGNGNADLNTKMKAIDILNKMSGEYTTKIEGDIGIKSIRVDIDEE